jgi:hypothetical protein
MAITLPRRLGQLLTEPGRPRAGWVSLAEMALALACGETARAHEAWRAFVDDPRTAPHRSDTGVVALEAELVLASATLAQVADRVRETLAVLASRPPMPDSVFDLARLRVVLVQAMRRLGQPEGALPALQALPLQDDEASDVQRFARERDILGALAHPHIERRQAAGPAADGQPEMRRPSR